MNKSNILNKSFDFKLSEVSNELEIEKKKSHELISSKNELQKQIDILKIEINSYEVKIKSDKFDTNDKNMYEEEIKKVKGFLENLKFK